MVILTLNTSSETLNQCPHQSSYEEFQFKTEQSILVQYVSNLSA